MKNTKMQGATFATTAALLTAAGAETVFDTTVTLVACINGKAFTKTAVTDGVTPTTDYNTGVAFPTLTANQGTVVVWAYQSNGTVRCMMGSIEDLDSTGAFAGVYPQFPAIKDDVCPFAYQILKAGSTAGTITFGSSNWNATGFTNTIQNVLVLPDRPQAS
jgi:hypothetical protein